MKAFTDKYGPQRMNPTDFGDPLTFVLKTDEWLDIKNWCKFIEDDL